MVNRPGAEHAAELTRKHPSLSVGLHFDDGAPIDLDDPDQAAEAFAAQLKRFHELIGADPTHVDSHHHAHARDGRMSVFAELVTPLGVPLRHDGRVRQLGGFYAQPKPGITELARVRRDYLMEMIRSEVAEGFTEISCHPARARGDFQSSYLDERVVELQTLTEPGLRQQIEALGVKLASYHDWRPEPRTG
jgi:predicted glycoside hydrolase/deacetylase ChbG (UPF0249 family)